MTLMKDNPYKPGTSEFKMWEKNLIDEQSLDTVDRQVAISIADRRLAQLKLQITPSQRTLALEDLLDSLPKPGEVFTLLQLLIQEVNTIWAETKLGVEYLNYLWIPQVASAPNWATKPQLYKVLHWACGVDFNTVSTSFGRPECYWPIHRSPIINMDPNDLSYDRVHTTFLQHMIVR